MPRAIKVKDEAPDFIPADSSPDFIPAEGSTKNLGTGEVLPPAKSKARQYLDIAGDVGTGVIKGAGNTVQGVSSMLNKIPVVGETLAPKQGVSALHDITRPTNAAQKTGYYGEQIGEFLLPGEAEEAALTKLPQIFKAGKLARGLSRATMQTIDSGVQNKMQGGSFKEGAEGGAIGAGIGAAGRAIAPHIAESAMGITRRAREFGRTPGAAILEDTAGVRPATVARNAGSRIADKTQQMESMVHDATQSGAMGSTQAAHDVLNTEIARAPRNARSYSAGLTGLRDLLHFDPPGTTLAPRFKYTPDELLEMKRGIGREVSNWNPEMRKGLGPVSRRLYSPIDKELDRLAPGTEELNQGISSLIPARDFMQRRALAPGLSQRTMGRIAAHTGALGSSLAGGYGGYRHGGIGEGILGATAGLVAPEALASPMGQMAIARGLHSFSGRLPAGLSLQALKALREKDEPPEEGGSR